MRTAVCQGIYYGIQCCCIVNHTYFNCIWMQVFHDCHNLVVYHLCGHGMNILNALGVLHGYGCNGSRAVNSKRRKGLQVSLNACTAGRIRAGHRQSNGITLHKAALRSIQQSAPDFTGITHKKEIKVILKSPLLRSVNTLKSR